MDNIDWARLLTWTLGCVVAVVFLLAAIPASRPKVNFLISPVLDVCSSHLVFEHYAIQLITYTIIAMARNKAPLDAPRGRSQPDP